MRSWHNLLLAVSLMACGGIVADPPSGATDRPAEGNDTPSSSGGSGGSASTSNPTPTPAPTPTTLPTPTPSIFAGATGFEVSGAILGAPPGGSNYRAYSFEPSPTTVTVSTEDSEGLLELTPAEAGKLGDLMASVRPMAMPTECSYDGPASGLVVTRSGTKTLYVPADFNCLHRTDVSYASGIPTVLAFLDSVRASR